MVKRKNAFRIFIAAALVITAVVLAAGLCLAQEEEAPTINEEYRVIINEVGDGHIVDTITYQKDDYAEIKKVEKDNRGFLTRRFTTVDNTGELVDFKTDLDDAKRSVVLTYDKPGFVYNEKGRFAVYGLPEKPKDEDGKVFTFEEKSTINSEFTLFTDQVILTRTVIELPGSASNARYDAEESAVLYDMPPASAQMGFFSENKTLLSIVFAVMTLAFGTGLVLVIRRKPEAPTAGVAAPAPEPVPATLASAAVQAPPETTGPAAAAAPAPEPAPAAEQPPKAKKFCRKCGARVKPGRKFCTKCGTEV